MDIGWLSPIILSFLSRNSFSYFLHLDTKQEVIELSCKVSIELMKR
jgi:hypothetical protein